MADSFFIAEGLRVHQINMGPYGNNGYLVVCTATEEGVVIDTPAEPEKLLAELGDVRVRAILITHNHRDHLFGLEAIHAATQAPIACHPADAHALPIRPHLGLHDGQRVPFGRQAITVLHTPGHTPGACCYLMDRFLFSGDTLFPGGPGKSASPEALRQELQSIETRLLALPDETLVLPGHGGNGSIRQVRRDHAVFQSRPLPPDLHGDVEWLGAPKA